MKGSLVLGQDKKSSKLYSLQASISTNIVKVVESTNTSNSWHKRLSHISEKGENLLLGLSDAKLDICDHHLARKYHCCRGRKYQQYNQLYP